jgi:phage-related holin
MGTVTFCEFTDFVVQDEDCYSSLFTYMYIYNELVQILEYRKLGALHMYSRLAALHMYSRLAAVHMYRREINYTKH